MMGFPSEIVNQTSLVAAFGLLDYPMSLYIYKSWVFLLHELLESLAHDKCKTHSACSGVADWFEAPHHDPQSSIRLLFRVLLLKPINLYPAELTEEIGCQKCSQNFCNS